MKKRILLLFVVVISFICSIFLSIFVFDKVTINKETNLRYEIRNSDLSQLLIDGHKLGEQVTKIDKRVDILYFEDGSSCLGMFGNEQKISKSKIKLITARFSKEETEVINNGEILTSISDIKKNLGDNYIYGLPILGSTETITYVDRVNNIELVIDNEEDIYLKRIDDLSFRISYTPILKYRYDPFNVIL